MSNKTIHELDNLSDIAQNDEMLIYDISAGADNPTKKTTAGNLLNFIKDNSKDVYSTDEVKTNKVWIDGKPIYRKVLINSSNISGETPAWGGLQSSIASLNIAKCTASYAVCTNGLRYLQFLPDTGFISFYSGVINGSNIVLEYTKN